MREVKYTTRFQRDYRREESARQARSWTPCCWRSSTCSPPTLRCRAGLSITHCPANGTITATATSGRILFSSTASQMTTASNLSALAHIVSLGCENGGARFKLDPFVEHGSASHSQASKAG